MPINPINRDSRPFPALSSPTSGAVGKDEQKLKKACRDLESLFIQQILKSMRQALPRTNFIGGGTGEEVFQSLFDQELSRSLTERKGIGLGEMIYRQMTRRESPSPADSITPLPEIRKGASSISGKEDP